MLTAAYTITPALCSRRCDSAAGPNATLTAAPPHLPKYTPHFMSALATLGKSPVHRRLWSVSGLASQLTRQGAASQRHPGLPRLPCRQSDVLRCKLSAGQLGAHTRRVPCRLPWAEAVHPAVLVSSHICDKQLWEG